MDRRLLGVRTLAGLLGVAWLAGACSGVGGSGENFNKPAIYEGPGCYDFKGRIERTITTSFECSKQGWVWRTEPKPLEPAASQSK